MSRIITCAVIFEAGEWWQDLSGNPGSDKARERGCTCPTEQPPDMIGQFFIDLDCPVHELERAEP